MGRVTPQHPLTGASRRGAPETGAGAGTSSSGSHARDPLRGVPGGSVGPAQPWGSQHQRLGSAGSRSPARGCWQRQQELEGVQPRARSRSPPLTPRLLSWALGGRSERHLLVISGHCTPLPAQPAVEIPRFSGRWEPHERQGRRTEPSSGAEREAAF